MRIKVAAALALAGIAWAHDPITTNLTWSAEISRIVYKHCASCHRDGGTAFSLLQYDDARPWAKAMRDEVLARRMPPWGAVKGVGEFAGDPSLSQPEMDMMVAWVEGGAPEGDAIYLPPAPAVGLEGTAEPAGARLVVSGRTVLKDSEDVVALRPVQLAEGAQMEVTAYKPDGSVEHLIWLRQYRRKWQRTYVCRAPVRLPKGTQIAVYAPEGSSAALTVIPVKP